MPGSTRIDELRQKFHENPRRYFAPLANEYRKAGDPEQAIAICRAHLAQQPGHMSGHVVYGQALYDARRTEEARGVFEKALALDPDNAIVLRQLGDIAREKGDGAEAKHWYTRAMDADPHDKEIAAYIAELTEPETETATAYGESDAAVATAEAEREAAREVAAAGNEPAVEPEPVEPERIAEPEPIEIPAPVTPALAAEDIELVAEAPAGESDREIQIAPAFELEPAPEPERAVPEQKEETPAPVEEEVAWRKTPPHEESPFVTRTMAELYASQGYREAALDVYRQLALHHPDDKEIFDRIEALEKDSSAGAPPSVTPPTKLSDLPFEPMISDVPSEPEPEHVKDYSEKAVYGASDEDDDIVTPVAGAHSPHFTEQELGGDSWDTDAWGAGFAADDEIDAEFAAPDVPATADSEAEAETAREPEISEPAAPEPVEPQVAQLDPQPVEFEPLELESAREPEAVASSPELVEPAPAEPEPAEPEPAEPEPVEAASAPEPVATEWDAGFEQEREEEAFVAYSPQPPADDKLPHFAPKGPTVREFFAALGAFRPDAPKGSSITAHAAAPQAAVESDFPLATDAFSNLFSDSPVSEDDSRAAFAMSGALGSSQPEQTSTPTPSRPAPPVEAPVPTATAQESDEDIRRFREWLDGLAES